jgi:hypothetical protein
MAGAKARLITGFLMIRTLASARNVEPRSSLCFKDGGSKNTILQLARNYTIQRIKEINMKVIFKAC